MVVSFEPMTDILLKGIKLRKVKSIHIIDKSDIWMVNEYPQSGYWVILRPVIHNKWCFRFFCGVIKNARLNKVATNLISFPILPFSTFCLPPTFSIHNHFILLFSLLILFSLTFLFPCPFPFPSFLPCPSLPFLLLPFIPVSLLLPFFTLPFPSSPSLLSHLIFFPNSLILFPPGGGDFIHPRVQYSRKPEV